MIISHEHRFIFFAVPKTATHSIRYALRTVLEPNDWEQVDLFQKNRLPIPEIESIGHGHITAMQAKEHLSDAIWTDYHKFAFVRNPFERFVSSCFFLFNGNKVFDLNPSAFMKLLFKERSRLNSLHFLPQTQFICDNQNQILLDEIGKLESLEKDFAQICNRLSINCSLGEKKNQSKHSYWSEYLDEELYTLIKKAYASDFTTFGYFDK